MNGVSTAQEIVHQQSKRVRKIVENADYSTYETFSQGRKVVDLFIIDGITAMLERNRKRSVSLLLGGGGIVGALLVGLDLYLRWKGLR